MEHLEIYSLQDQVIQTVMNADNQFYLTGGTALQRFYCHARHSFDLDFFVINGVRVDNIINILTNKLCAIVSRDEPKDVIDLFCIAFHERFNWDAILEIANKKAVVEREILIYRLKTFPLDSLRKLHIINELPITPSELEKMVEDIKEGIENSLYKTNEKHLDFYTHI